MYLDDVFVVSTTGGASSRRRLVPLEIVFEKRKRNRV
jgi:hypothetical protein